MISICAERGPGSVTGRDERRRIDGTMEEDTMDGSSRFGQNGTQYGMYNHGNTNYGKGFGRGKGYGRSAGFGARRGGP